MTRLTLLPVTLLSVVMLIGGCGGNSPQSALKKGFAEFEKENYSETIALLNRAAQEIDNSSDLYYTLGLAYLHLGDMDKALDALNKTVDLTPVHCEALICLGQIAYHKTEFEYSRKCYETALKLSPDIHTKAILYTSLALTESGLKNNGLARLYLIRALSCDNSYAPAMYNLGSVYRDKFGFKEEALNYFRAYLQTADKSEAHFEKAQNNITRLQNNIKRKAVERKTGSNAVKASQALEAAINFQVTRQYQKALNSYETALNADPAAFSAAYGKAMMHQKLNNRLEALGAFKKALAINPDHQDSYVRAIGIALALRKYDEALVLLDRAIARNPQYVSWYDLMARVLYGQEKYHEALKYGEYFLSLMKPDDESRKSYEKWVMALREAG